MHLKKLPTYFTKGDQRIAVYHTVHARELRAEGWTEETATAPEAPAEAVEDAVDDVDEVDLEGMTRAELIAFAQENEIEFKAYASKAEILEACKEFVDG
jgi:hypothetical protein